MNRQFPKRKLKYILIFQVIIILTNSTFAQKSSSKTGLKNETKRTLICQDTLETNINDNNSGVIGAGKVLRVTGNTEENNAVYLYAENSIELLENFSVDSNSVLSINLVGCQESVVISDDVIIVESDMNNNLVMISQNRIDYSSGFNQEGDIALGKILVSDLHPNAPLGYMRIITGISNGPQDILIIDTENASLTDVVESADMSYSFPLANLIKDTESYRVNQSTGTIEVELNTVEIPGPASLEGRAFLNPDFIFDIKITEDEDSPHYVKIGTKGDIEITMILTLEQFTTLDDVVEIFEIELPHIRFFLGPVPVIISQDLELNFRYTLEGPQLNFAFQRQGTFEVSYNKIGDSTPTSIGDVSFDPIGINFEETGASTLIGEIAFPLKYEWDLYDFDILEAAAFVEVGANFEFSPDECGGNIFANAGLQIGGEFLESIGFEEAGINVIFPIGNEELDLEACDSVDSDGDGIWNIYDNCPAVSNPGQIDQNGNGVGDLCENTDTDNDGINDEIDNCPTQPNPNQTDIDGDGIGDTCDNCPTNLNPFQSDSDNDGIGDICQGTLTDIDGNTYQTVLIGNRFWMAENLRTSKYSDGSAIPNITNGNSWITTNQGAYCYYNNDASNNSDYGKLYNWLTILDQRKVCPTGWHVPSETELLDLVNAAGGLNDAGISLREEGDLHWFVNPNNDMATNSTNFTALPGGFRQPGAGNYSNRELFGYHWSSTSTNNGDGAIALLLTYYNETLFSQGTNINSGLSIRCVQD